MKQVFYYIRVMTHIKALYRYPVKSLGRQSLSEVEVLDHGLKYDRHWMIVDNDNQFITQREIPQLTKLIATVNEDILSIRNTENKESYSIASNEISNHVIDTNVWRAKVKASYISEEINSWLSDQIGQRLCLVGAGTDFERVRIVDKERVPLKFADGYPILVLSQSSVDNLNTRLETPVTESRFRANIIIDGCPAHTEDLAGQASTSEVVLQMIKPCKRCVMINTDQSSGNVNKEPLKTLAQYRAYGNNVMFGINARATQKGLLRVNDELSVSLKV